MTSVLDGSISNDAEQPTAARHVFQGLFDAVSWVMAIVLGVLLRYDFRIGAIEWEWIVLLCAIAALLQGVIGWAMSLYRGRHQYGTFHEAKPLLLAVGYVATIIFAITAVSNFQTGIPRSTALIALPLAFVFMGGGRYLRRLVAERRSLPRNASERTLVYGAGFIGENLVKRMLADPSSPYLPVGLIDDDRRKKNLRLSNIPVLGTGTDMARVAANTHATALVLCIGHADSEFIRTLADQAKAAGIRMMVLPLLSDILAGKVGLGDVRDVAIEDLIGRHPVDTEVESIAGYIRNKRVLVTGAGGSIGSELCRQLVKFSPSELIMLDRDETALQGAQFSIFGHGLLDTKEVVLADIRDGEVMEEIFESRRPQVVFHAAALKHLSMLEQYPDEGWKTNVLGTSNVLAAAQQVSVETFINISTDKAANPTSVLGRTKRLAERLTARAAEESEGTFLSVRFGNVIGSRGSMLPLFTSQIEAGGPITVTHPDVTRYFMTIPEACQLVVQAGGIGRDGEVLILDMGEPVRILDVATRMIAMTGRNVEIKFTGLRTGEKLHEDLVASDEVGERPFHPRISHSSVPPLPLEELNAIRLTSDADRLRQFSP